MGNKPLQPPEWATQSAAAEESSVVDASLSAIVATLSQPHKALQDRPDRRLLECAKAVELARSTAHHPKTKAPVSHTDRTLAAQAVVFQHWQSLKKQGSQQASEQLEQQLLEHCELNTWATSVKTALNLLRFQSPKTTRAKLIESKLKDRGAVLCEYNEKTSRCNQYISLLTDYYQQQLVNKALTATQRKNLAQQTREAINSLNLFQDLSALDDKIADAGLRKILANFNQEKSDTQRNNYNNIRLTLERMIKYPVVSLGLSILNYIPVARHGVKLFLEPKTHDLLLFLYQQGGIQALEDAYDKFFSLPAENREVSPRLYMENFTHEVLVNFHKIQGIPEKQCVKQLKISGAQREKGLLDPFMQAFNAFTESFGLPWEINKQETDGTEVLYRQCQILLDQLASQAFYPRYSIAAYKKQLDTCQNELSIQHHAPLVRLRRDLAIEYQSYEKSILLAQCCHELLRLQHECGAIDKANALRKKQFIKERMQSNAPYSSLEKLYSELLDDFSQEDNARIGFRRCEALLNALPPAVDKQSTQHFQAWAEKVVAFKDRYELDTLSFADQCALNQLKKDLLMEVADAHEARRMQASRVDSLLKDNHLIYLHRKRIHPNRKELNRRYNVARLENFLADPLSIILGILVGLINVVAVFDFLVAGGWATVPVAITLSLIGGTATFLTNAPLVKPNLLRVGTKFIIDWNFLNGYHSFFGVLWMLLMLTMGITTGVIMGAVMFMSGVALPTVLTFVPLSLGYGIGTVGLIAMTSCFGSTMYDTLATVTDGIVNWWQKTSVINVLNAIGDKIHFFYHLPWYTQCRNLLKGAIRGLLATAGVGITLVASIALLGAWNKHTFGFMTKILHASAAFSLIFTEVIVAGLTSLPRTLFNGRNVMNFAFTSLSHIENQLYRLGRSLVNTAWQISKFCYHLVTNRHAAWQQVTGACRPIGHQVGHIAKRLHTEPGALIRDGIHLVLRTGLVTAAIVAVGINALATAFLSAGGAQYLMSAVPILSLAVAKITALATAVLVSMSTNGCTMIRIFGSKAPITFRAPSAPKSDLQTFEQLHRHLSSADDCANPTSRQILDKLMPEPAVKQALRNPPHIKTTRPPHSRTPIEYDREMAPRRSQTMEPGKNLPRFTPFLTTVRRRQARPTHTETCARQASSTEGRRDRHATMSMVPS